MATELGQAYVQIMPSAKGIQGSITKQLSPEASSAGKSAGSIIGGALKTGILAALGAGALGIGAILKSAIPAGADLQQNLGGTKAVFGEFAKSIQNDAKNAYINMGLSASDYMATANKMGSLFQGSGVEQQKALDMTSKAMQRAADVASVMGVDMGMAMESIAGAAKGNFTMMDNLGVAMNATTLEAYALEKGINFKWNTASNAEKAELAMKMFMDRTIQYAGNFANEAEGTFSGSLGAMQGAWKNVLGNLSLGEDLTEPLNGLAKTTSWFLFNNFIPMVGNVFKGLPSAIGTFIAEASPLVAQQFQGLFSNLGTSVDLSPITSKFQGVLTAFQPVMAGLQTAFGQLPSFFSAIGATVGPVITTIMDGIARMDFSGFQVLIASVLPALQAGFQTFMSIVSPAIDSVVQSFVSMWNAAQPLITILSGALMPILQILGSFLGGVLKGVLSGVSFAFDALKVAIELVTPIVEFLVNALKTVQPVLSVIAEWVGVAIGMFGNLGTAGQGLSAFTKSAWTNIQSAIQTAGNIIRTVIDWIKLAFSGAGNAVGVLKNVFSLAWMAIGDVVNVARNLIGRAISGIKSAFTSFQSVVSSVGGAVTSVVNSIISTIKGLANIDISGAGAAIMNGFLGGLQSAWEGVKSFVGGIADWIARNKGPISYDRVLLKPAGLAIMQGLNTNLQVGFKDVMSTVSGMAGAIAKPFEGQSLAYDMTSSASVNVRRNLSSTSGDFSGGESGTNVVARLANIERFLSTLVDKELAVYLDGERLAQNSYMHQGAIMAREGI